MEQTFISINNLKTIKDWLGSGSINIFGIPFAGKDTHGSILAELFDAPLVSGGDILRNSILPLALQKELNAGHLIPTERFMQIVIPYFSQPDFNNRPLILSSVGRWFGEEVGVLAATQASDHETKAVIYLNIGEDAAYKRLQASREIGDRSGRTDDAQHILNTRLQEFKDKTLPVIEVYRQKKLLIEVNSDATKREVTENILARLLLLATNHD